ncbi:MAG: endonuclease/exonuclease/phosphatase family protein [Candidatus Cloacimonetes bacterium]|nr:endonuclease/exonuclease/phosphatase family protein [Candidatus Cloacimonadota bacterium]
MKQASFLLVVIALLFTSCGENTVVNVIDPNIDNGDYFVGSNETLEVMTWNIQEFPKSSSTVGFVAQIIDSLQIDIIAMQEINSAEDFQELETSLSGWEKFRANSASYDINLAYFYKANLDVDNIYEIYTDDWYSFPRPPLVMEMFFQTKSYVIINNHFKAYGDEESVDRRRQASQKLELYCNNNFAGQRIVIVGDLNDSLTDGEENNVFLNFLNSPDYAFADQAIAESSSANWSYFNYSHIDHILISDELFEAFENEQSTVLTMKVEKIIGGESIYKSNISDHRPVAIKLFNNF